MGGSFKALVLALLFGVTFAVLIAPSVSAAGMYKSSLSIEDYRGVIQAGASNPQVHQLMGNGKSTVDLNAGASSANAQVDNGQVTAVYAGVTNDADFTITTSNDALLSIANAPDPGTAMSNALTDGLLIIRAKDAGKQAAINAALKSGALKPTPPQGTPFGKGLIMATGNTVLNKFGGLVGYVPPKFSLYSNPPASFGLYFNKPPGILHQFPGLVYDTVTKSPNVMGPHNVFKINPGLVGPDKILALNPGLIGPADMALINPGLKGPAEFAYLMGIGAHSNSAAFLQSQGLVNNPFLGVTNRWGGSVTIRP